MAAYVLGVVLFAVGIALTIALHEAGHMFSARAFGMRVRRYFIGFGPKIASVTKGHTEYGIAAVPFGGFCEIAGMTAQDEVTEEEAPYAMVNKPWWQRVIVLCGGVIMNMLLGIVILYGVAVASGIPNPYADHTPTVEEVTCTADQDLSTGELKSCTGVGAGGRAGIQTGDRILAVDGHALKDFRELADITAAAPGKTLTFTVERHGATQDIPVTVDEVVRYSSTGSKIMSGSVGLVGAPVKDAMKRFGPGEAVGATWALTGQLLQSTVEGVLRLPSMIPGVVASIFGAERDMESPMSVVGASRMGGELVEHSLWDSFWLMLASLNFFLALFNVVPLPPLDGGHIVVVLYEALRNQFRRWRGLAPGKPVDYHKLMPLTYTMAFILLFFGILVMVADVVNPVRLFG